MWAFELTDHHTLPGGTSVPAVLAKGGIRTLTAVANTYYAQKQGQEQLDEIDRGERVGTPAELAQRRQRIMTAFFDGPKVTALDVLQANRRLQELLADARWRDMREAREQGDSWTAIGTALGMTKQGAIDWYKRKLPEQERKDPVTEGVLYADRSRAVLDEQE